LQLKPEFVIKRRKVIFSQSSSVSFRFYCNGLLNNGRKQNSNSLNNYNVYANDFFCVKYSWKRNSVWCCKCVLSVLVNDCNTYQGNVTDLTFVFQYTCISNKKCSYPKVKSQWFNVRNVNLFYEQNDNYKLSSNDIAIYKINRSQPWTSSVLLKSATDRSIKAFNRHKMLIPLF